MDMIKKTYIIACTALTLFVYSGGPDIMRVDVDSIDESESVTEAMM